VVISLHGEWNSQQYAQSNIGQFKHAVKELPKLSLKGSEKVLDIGSGDGLVTLHIAKNYLPNGQIDGVDKDSSMINFAQSRIEGELSNITFIHSDIMTYETTKKYDVITSFWTLHWLPDYSAVLQKISSLLNQSGKTLLCHIADSNNIAHIINITLEDNEWAQYKETFHEQIFIPSLETIVAAIRKSGLIIEHIEVKKNGEWMPVECFRNNLLSMPRFDFVPKEKREEFFDLFLEEYIAENPLNEEGNVLYWQPVIVLVLRK
jgi:trans-aconitate methyltransferase